MSTEKKTTRLKLRKVTPDRIRPARKRKSTASPALTELLGKLAGWTPDSDEQVLEVANRLGQAAREELDRGKVRDSRKFSAKLANDLAMHNQVLRFPGVEKDPGAENTVIFHLLYFTKFNRIGDWGMYRLNRSVHLGDIQFFPVKRTLVIAGREKKISGKEGREVIMFTISNLFGAIPDVIKEQLKDAR